MQGWPQLASHDICLDDLTTETTQTFLCVDWQANVTNVLSRRYPHLDVTSLVLLFQSELVVLAAIGLHLRHIANIHFVQAIAIYGC